MNEEELRAFLDSATVGDDDQPEEEAAEPTAALPGTPGDERPESSEQPALSFDELIGRNLDRARGGEEVPLVLPGPPGAAPAKPAPASPPARPASAPVVRTEPPAQPKPAGQAAPTVPVIPVTPAASAMPPAPEPPRADPLPPTLPIPAPTQTFDLGSGGDDYEPIAVTGGEHRPRRLVPWIIVAAGVVIALLGAFFVVNALTSGGGSDGQQNTASESDGQGGSGSDATEPGTSTGTTGPSTTSSRPTTTDSDDEVPHVEVGDTMNLQVTQWSVQVDMSQKLGLTASYSIPDGANLELSSSLIDSYAAACPGGQWGMTRVDDTHFEVLKPTQRCSAAPELYDELWGLMDAMVRTARPL